MAGRAKLPATIQPENVVVTIDSREQCPIDVSPMLSEVGTLTTADYGLKALPHLCAVERKSESDLLGCIFTWWQHTSGPASSSPAFCSPPRGVNIESCAGCSCPTNPPSDFRPMRRRRKPSIAFQSRGRRND